MSRHPPATSRTKHPKAIWVESATTAVRVDNPHVDGNTIFGLEDGRPFTMPTPDSTVVTVQHFDWVPAAMGAAGVGLMAYAVATANHPKQTCWPVIPCGIITMPGVNLCAGC
jgi:hypothetical protein